MVTDLGCLNCYKIIFIVRFGRVKKKIEGYVIYTLIKGIL